MPSHELSLMSASGDAKEAQALKTYIISTLLELQIPMSMAVEAAEDIVSFESEFIQRIKVCLPVALEYLRMWNSIRMYHSRTILNRKFFLLQMANQECGDSTQDDERRVLRDVRVDSVQQIRDYVPEVRSIQF